MLKSLKNNLIWTEGKYILFIAMFLILLAFISYKLLLLPIILVLFGFLFFRNPNRVAKNLSPLDIISPADGKVVDISISDNQKKISIFLSPFNVHVNWIPISGSIKEVSYKPGKFKPAFVPKSSELNERNDIVILKKNGQEVLVRQIAGMMARRISCWVKPLEKVKVGQKYGIIHFSSRVDLILPNNIDIKIKLGQKVVGGETIIAKWI